MTFNAAFPSSPLSRSTIQRDGETTRIAGGVSRQRKSLTASPDLDSRAGPSSWTTRSQMSTTNRGPNPLLLSPIQGTTSPRTSLLSTSPLYPPPLTHTPDSIASRSLATSPVSNMRLSPVFRSSPSSTSRRRFSEHSYSPGPNFGSFVGSYEESLLNGRMSSLPSKPLMFDAELGVLGLGKCKASLKCPPHVTFKFPAHFYSLDKTSEKDGSLSPGTPYVGTIDVEGHYIDALVGSSGTSTPSDLNIDPERPMPIHDIAFPGYRIPPKGQIQLIIKNPNMTAVKLFLVPYDFTDMPAGTKTFIRQKSHVASSGPGVVSSSTSLLRSPDLSTTSTVRETLKYAIHLHFCALPSSRSSKARKSEPGFNAGGLERLHNRRRSDETESKSKKQGTNIYLHRQIRVVFDARVPDRSESLRIVTDTPAGSDDNRQYMYSMYTGPSEEWKEAKRMRRAEVSAERNAQSSLLQEGGVHISRKAEEIPAEEINDGIVNSDPNGEKWFAESATPDYDAMDIPLTSRSPWRDPKPELQEHTMRESTSISAPAQVTSFPSAAFIEGTSITTISAAIQHTTRSEEERSEDDRALLEQWHAALNLRTQTGRPSSPLTPIPRDSKPTSPHYSKRSTSPTNGFFSLMNRSTSSVGSNGSNGSSAGPSHRSILSTMAPVMRSTSAHGNTEGSASAAAAATHTLPLSRPVQASLDLDPATGVIEPSSAYNNIKKPALIRHRSSQVHLNSSNTVRASPHDSPAD